MGTIERFFLLNLLRISLVGTSLVLITDLMYAEDTLSIAIDVVIVVACAVSFFVRRWSYNAAVLIVSGMTLAAMCYQWWIGVNTASSLAVIMLLGLIYSILLKGPLMWGMHALTCSCILVILWVHNRYPDSGPPRDLAELATQCATYFVLYFIFSYITGILKLRYDEINSALRTANDELLSKAGEIEAKNKALLESHEDINEWNKNLERLVMERTAKVQEQNKMLLKYTYTNAHYLRGPVARLLGLISIHKLESDPDHAFFFSQMEKQANEIDGVVKQINSELEEGPPATKLQATSSVSREHPH